MQPLNRTPHTTERGYVLTFLYRLQALQDQLNADLMTHAAYHARRDALRAQARRAVVSGMPRRRGGLVVLRHSRHGKSAFLACWRGTGSDMCRPRGRRREDTAAYRGMMSV